jgi:hypothetical protein
MLSWLEGSRGASDNDYRLEKERRREGVKE